MRNRAIIAQPRISPQCCFFMLYELADMFYSGTLYNKSHCSCSSLQNIATSTIDTQLIHPHGKSRPIIIIQATLFRSVTRTHRPLAKKILEFVTYIGLLGSMS